MQHRLLPIFALRNNKISTIMNTNIIEPCCTERQLNTLLRESSDRNVSFATSGDVIITHLMNAISGMPGGVAQEITLCMPEIPRTLLSQLGYKISRGWASQLRLVTAEPLTADDLQSLAGRSGLTPEQLLSSSPSAAEDDGVSAGLRSAPATSVAGSVPAGSPAAVILAADPTLAFSFLGYRGEKGSVYVCGHLLTKADNCTHLYVAKWRPRLRSVPATSVAGSTDFLQHLIDSRIKLHTYNYEYIQEMAAEAPAEESPAAETPAAE